ncbi:hypothetical protein VNO77_19256 [Canavalia gladiata]|uniref:DNA/RNA-binding domain-containing protein n=1 Tax=Canavalia gladiata TaxID=3824 RepID=A0AAN9LQM4_CANGL
MESRKSYGEKTGSKPFKGSPVSRETVSPSLVTTRSVCILVFTVYKVNREFKGQTYVEIVQRAVLLQNAFIAAFELMDHILERWAQLPDPSTSYLLPSILVFIEWLACYPDLVVGNDVDEN